MQSIWKIFEEEKKEIKLGSQFGGGWGISDIVKKEEEEKSSIWDIFEKPTLKPTKPQIGLGVEEKGFAEKPIAEGGTTLTKLPSQHRIQSLSLKEEYAPKLEPEPTWGNVVKNSLKSGLGQFQASLVNLIRLVDMGVTKLTDPINKIISIDPEKAKAFKEKYGVDPNMNTTDMLTKIVEESEKIATESQEQAESKQWLKKLIGTGLQATPQIVGSAILGVGMPIVGGLAAAKPTAEIITRVTQMIPFGLSAMGGQARQIEKEYEELGKEAPYYAMVIGGALSGVGEMATELPVFMGVARLLKGGTKALINEGAKTLIDKYGKLGIEFAKNVALQSWQEAEMVPIEKGIKQAIGLPQDWSIEPLVKEMGVNAYGGMAMALVLGGLGGSVMGSTKIATKTMEAVDNVIQNKGDIRESLKKIAELQGIIPAKPEAVALGYTEKEKEYAEKYDIPLEKVKITEVPKEEPKETIGEEEIKVLEEAIGKKPERILEKPLTAKEKFMAKMEEVRTKKAEISEVGEKYTGKAYRAETHIPEHGAEVISGMDTAQEKLDYDYGTTGNYIFKEAGKLAENLGIDLTKVPIEEMMWVAKDIEIAEKYDGAKEVKISEDTIILAKDKEGGSLILKNSKKYIEEKPLLEEEVTVSLEEEGRVEALWAGEEVGGTEEAVDPVVKLNELIKKAKPLRGKLEKQYTEERGKRIKEVERVIDEIGGEEGYRIALSKLKGELVKPEAKIAFEPIKDKLSKSELDTLYNKNFKHPYLDEWEKISAASELTKLLSGELPTPKGLVLLEEIYGTNLMKSILSKRALGLKITDVLIDLGNLPRAILATADMSAFLRQGVVYVVSHPIISAKAMKKTFKFAFSPKAFDQYFKDLTKDPLYPLMRKSGLAITDPSRVSVSGREEMFISRLAQQTPIVGHIIKFAERAYVGFLNKLRVDVFKTFADELLSKGFSPVKDAHLFKATAEVVNTFTGRGSMGTLNRITPQLNIIFFSPRLITARFNALNPIWYAKAPKEIRMKAIGDFGKFVATGLTFLALIKASDLGDVELDPRSSDFGKIRIGNTRWDIWGGFQQWARVFAQVITGKRKNTATGEIISLTKDDYPFTTRKEVILRFIEGKLAPVPALVNELISGAKTFEGEDITFRTVAREKFIPMYIQDITEAYMDGGLGRSVGAGLPAFFGVGVQTWQERKKKKQLSEIWKTLETKKTKKSNIWATFE